VAELLEKSAILDAIERTHGNVTLAARALGAPVGQVRAQIQGDPELVAAVEEARASVVDAAETQLRAAVNNREEWAIKFAIAREQKRAEGYRAISDEPPPKIPGGKLTRQQQNQLIEWAAEGLRLWEINERAAKADPPFMVEYLQLKHARKRSAKKFTELRARLEAEATDEGLARRAVRIRRLIQLAEKLEEDFYENARLWVREPKEVTGERVEIERFNAAEVKQWRGLLDDIAKEMGERKTSVDLTTKGQPLSFAALAQLATNEQPTTSANDPGEKPE